MKLIFVGAVAAIAALIALQAVSAAELPMRQAKPEPQAKKCRIGGQEGVILPGSTTCIRLSGYVSAGVAFGAVGNSPTR